MKGQRVNFYFILYLIAVISIFEAITERDKGRQKIQQIRDDLKKVYSTPPRIVVQDKHHFTMKTPVETDTIRISQTVSLLSDDDRIEYSCTRFGNTDTALWTPLPITPDPAAHGEYVLPIRLSGNINDSIRITLKVNRVVPSTYPPDVRIEIQHYLDSLGGTFETAKTVSLSSLFTAATPPEKIKMTTITSVVKEKEEGLKP